MNNRQLISVKELEAWLNNQIQTQKGYEKVVVELKYGKIEPDLDGCNWNPNPKQIRGIDAGRVIKEAVVIARNKFNIR